MEIVIRGHHLPGRMFRSAGVPVHNVHVAVQVRDVPEGITPADAPSAEWHIDVRADTTPDGTFDIRGPAVHGRRGERFVYLTWGDLSDEGGFAMFRRAKLMLGDIDAALIRSALASGAALVATVGLTDGYGGPICARVPPAAVVWSVAA